MPFIKKKSLYLISYHKEILEDRNYRYMSFNVINELAFRDEFSTITVTTNRGGK